MKVLDFGLAKAMEPRLARRLVNTSQSPTITTPAMTQAGMILGTAAYMSPEQAAGTPVDRRADIWAYGVVLWEMLCGRRLFGGDTVVHTLADVLRRSIEFDKLDVPAPIKTLLRRCLDRDAKTRLRDIGEARVAIASISRTRRAGLKFRVGRGPSIGGLLGPRRRFLPRSRSSGGCGRGRRLPAQRPRIWR